MANNGHSDTHTLITSKIAAINARVSQNEDLIRRAEAAEVPASMDALLHRIEMFGRAKHDEGYYRDGDDLKSLNRERAAADLAEIRAMLAALKAQQPAPVASQFDRDVRSLVSRLSVLQVLLAEHHPEHHAAVHEAICNLEHESRSRTMFVARLENMQKNRDLWLTVTAVLSLLNDCDMLAQQPAPVDAEGLPPLPEPDGGADVTEDMGRTMSVVPAWSEPLVRRAQREAVAAYVLKCQREARTAVETIRQGAKT